MAKKRKETPAAAESLDSLIALLQAFDHSPSFERAATKREARLKEAAKKLETLGETAVPALVDVLKKQNYPSFAYAAATLAAIGDTRAIEPLVENLEDRDLGKYCQEALVEFGPGCVPDIIKSVEYRIAHPVPDRGLITHTHHALRAIGDIRCPASAAFLNTLLDDYMKAIPGEAFDTSKMEWAYRNVDFFHLLDCMVRQQDKSAIPHIKKAQGHFPKEYTDYLICQIAAGRIKKGRVEGYLPLEVMDIAMPSKSIMNAFLGIEPDGKDDFMEEYGEYFEEDDEQEDNDEV